MNVVSMTGASLERIFLDWDGPALPRAGKILAEHYGGTDGLDLRGAVVVTPGGRAGRRLGEILLEEAERLGQPLTPPRLVTTGRLPELLYRAERPAADALAARLAFTHALRRTDPRLLRDVFPALPGTLAGWLATAGVVAGLHRETMAQGLRFSDIARAIREGFPYDDSSRWRVLARVQELYLETLGKAGLVDPDQERIRAVEEGRLVDPGDVWLVGVVEIPGVLRRMLEAGPGAARALIHAPAAMAERFDGFGCVRAEAWADVPIPLEEERIRVVRRPSDQADAVVSVLQGFDGRFAAEEVVVGVPDPELVPYVEQALSSAGVAHRFAVGSRLEDTGPFRLLEGLAAYLDGRTFPAFASLLRHPDLDELLGSTWREGDVTGPLTLSDRFQTRHLQASLEGSLPGGDRAAAEMRGLVVGLERSLSLEDIEGDRSLSGWMPTVLGLLATVYEGEPLDLGTRRARHLLEVITRIRDAATRMAALPGALEMECGAWDAVAVLLAQLRGERVPPEPEEEAVELLGWLELPLDDAPAVVITGANDRRIPEAAGADPFLPGALRSRLGLPDDGARYARDAYLLSAMVHARKELHLVAGRTSATGDPLRLSRLLFAASPRKVAERIRRFLDDDEPGTGRSSKEAPPGAGGSRGQREGGNGDRPSGFRSPPEDPVRARQPITRIRVTDFSDFLKDPYRFALTRVLGLEPLRDDAREMDGPTFGSLAHRVLERFGRSEEAGSADPRVVIRKLNRLLDGAVHEEFGRRPVPAVRVQVEQLRARLHAFARWQAGWVSDGWRVVCVEQQPEGGVPFLVDGEVARLGGTIDRIDHHPDTGAWAILDYKTADGGKSPEETHRRGREGAREWVDLQLPLYRRLLAGILGEDGDPVVPEAAWKEVKLGYILLPKSLEGVGVSLAEWSEEELEEAEEEAREVVRALRTGEFFYDPGTRGRRDDPFDPLLGRKELPLAADRDEDEGGEE